MNKRKPNKRSKILLLSPLFGILVFVLLYILAAGLYPGGSALDKQAKGFSILHNYWCDLFDTVAHNGAINPARPIAIVAMLVLTASFALLWYLLPRLFMVKNTRQRIIQYTGVTSMIIAAFLFTHYHEAVIHLAGVVGGVALTLTFIELYRANQKGALILGLLCLVMSGINYFVYETGIGLFLLASTQKLTFLVFFVWAALINVDLYRKELYNFTQ